MMWYRLETKADYRKATERLEAIGDETNKEWRLLALLIADYESRTITWPDVDPIEVIRMRMDDLGLKAVDLAASYGDKGTVSKVLNYKQPLSLQMIRVFSKLLKVPAELLLKEYDLRQDR